MYNNMPDPMASMWWGYAIQYQWRQVTQYQHLPSRHAVPPPSMAYGRAHTCHRYADAAESFNIFSLRLRFLLSFPRRHGDGTPHIRCNNTYQATLVSCACNHSTYFTGGYAGCAFPLVYWYYTRYFLYLFPVLHLAPGHDRPIYQTQLSKLRHLFFFKST